MLALLLAVTSCEEISAILRKLATIRRSS